MARISAVGTALVVSFVATTLDLALSAPLALLHVSTKVWTFGWRGKVPQQGRVSENLGLSYFLVLMTAWCDCLSDCLSHTGPGCDCFDSKA